MEAPSPTPYDIVSIPEFPFAPSGLAWIVVIVGILSAYFLRKILLKRKSVRLSTPTSDELIRELCRYRNSYRNEPKQYLALSSILIRRFLDTESKLRNLSFPNMSGASVTDIRRFADSCSVAELKAVLQNLILIDERRYDHIVDIDSATKLMNDLEKEILSYIQNLKSI